MATFTKEQSDAIEAQGKVIVSASAGSGKTTVMIEKIIRLIKSGVSVNDILAVTFTKKAAAQMKEKLGKALIENINEEGITPEKRAELKKQLSEVPSADLSTIHSFCAKLIRTHFFAAGVDNAFRVIGGDDAEGTALKNEAMDELLEEGYENGDEDFAHLLSVYWRKKSDNKLRQIFMESYEDLRSRSDYKEYLERSATYDEGTFESVCADLHARFVEKCRYYLDLIENERIYFSSKQEAQAEKESETKPKRKKEQPRCKNQIALSAELCEWLETLVATGNLFALKEVGKPKFKQNRTSEKYTPEELLHSARLGFLKDRIVKPYDEEIGKLESLEVEKERFLLSARTAKAVAKYILIFDGKYAELKRERGVLDYNDLEHKALELLKLPEVVAEVRETYRYVFVDEYQDVNPVQEELISRLSGENLFLVGDVKQSIYGFRGSKSRFFVEKQRAFEAGEGKNLAMTRNFRSSDKVLAAVNSQFSLAMTPQTCDVDYARGSYMERGGRYELNSGRVAIHYLGETEKEDVERGIYSVREQTNKPGDELTKSAKLIKHIIDSERRSRYYDPDAGEEKEVRYSDIAILSRTLKGDISETVAALSAVGIPVTTAASVNVCDFAEVKTLIDILSLLDNAEQDVPLCSALLSAMGNLTADELVEIRLAYKESEDVPFFRTACKKYAAEKEDGIAEKLRSFYAYFESLRSRSRVLEAGELLTAMLSETRMETRLLSHENGVACLKRIHRFIEESASPEPLCVHAFLERLRDLDYEIKYSENGGEDSVKVMTMHSSKGLEYPIVIVDGLSATFRSPDHGEIVLEEKYGLAPRAFDEKHMTKAQTVLRRLYARKESEGSIADELNLYYVALTRAKFGLHMIFEERGIMSDVKYAKSYAELTDFSVWEEFETEDCIFDEEKQERTAVVFRPDEELARKIMRAFTWEYGHSGYENLPVKSSATQLIAGETADPSLFDGVADVGFGAAEEEINGLFDARENTTASDREMGTAYHAFLEYFDFSALYEEDGTPVSKERLRACVSESFGRFSVAYAEEAALLSLEKLVEILSNPVFYELRGMRLYKEQQFLVSLPVKDTYAKKSGVSSELKNRTDGEEMIFQGAIDLLAVGKEIRIIDYKYSAQGAAYLKEHYKRQLELYRLTVAKILGVAEDSVRCSIVNIRRGFQIDMD